MLSQSPLGVAVTGMGSVTPYGVGTKELFEALIEQRVAVKETTDPDFKDYSPVSTSIPDFDPADYLPDKMVRDTARFTHLLMVAAMEAIRDAGLPVDTNGQLRPNGVAAHRIGIFIGTGFGGIPTIEQGAFGLAHDGDFRVGPRMVSKSIPNAAAATLSAHYHVYGPVLTYTTACASSANAIGEAMLQLQSNRIDIAIAGGTDSLFSSTLLKSLHESGALATSGTGPYDTWSRPFDKDRLGMVPGEGAAALILERQSYAKSRGAHVHANVIGYGTSNDGYHQIAPEPNGRGAALAIRQALLDANLQPHDIDYINAHATATKAGDSAESKALWDVFGHNLIDIPVNSIKGHIGHVLGGAGAIEAIACIYSLQTGLLPPTMNCDNPDEGMPPVLVTGSAMKKNINTALSTSFGFGGQNGVVILRKSE